MAVLFPIRGVVAMITITGLVYEPQNFDNKTFDYAMIDADATECVLFNDDYDDYKHIKVEGEDVKNVTTFNVTHLTEEVSIKAVQVIEFRKPFGYLNLTDDQIKEMIKDGLVEVTEAEITIPDAVDDVIGKEKNDTGIVEMPSVVLIIKEEEKCLIMVKDKKNEIEIEDE